MRSVERDAFTIASGYPPGLRVEGIDIRDRVWLDRRLDSGTDRLPHRPPAGHQHQPLRLVLVLGGLGRRDPTNGTN